MRIFMPADSPHLNLCKTIMSAVALGYPLPTLLNWDGEFNRPHWHFAGSHIAKLTSLLAVIEELLGGTVDDGGAHEDDIALMIDAYDIWFQLPPQVLLDRFHKLNHETDERTQKSWLDLSQFGDTPVPAPQKQSIIVTSAKDCSPDWDSGSNPHYDYWPASPMPADMYGAGTDHLAAPIWDPARKYRKIRPRCVNSGMIMGTMGAMRQALRRCKEKVEMIERSGRQLWSDQALFAEVIGEQEIFRTWARGLASTWNGTAALTDLSSLAPEVRRVAEEALTGKQFDFGIGLDYSFATIPPTCSAEEDGSFVKLSDADAVRQESLRAGVPGSARVGGPPSELSQIPDANDPLHNVSWGEVPLYTDFYFGTTPVGIHHNAYVMNLKPWRLKNWWDKMWFYPNLRSLVTKNLQMDSSERTIAHVSDIDGTLVDYAHASRPENKVTIFHPSTESRGASLNPVDWDGVCQKGSKPWHESLFGDGLGELEI